MRAVARFTEKFVQRRCDAATRRVQVQARIPALLLRLALLLLALALLCSACSVLLALPQRILCHHAPVADRGATVTALG